MMENHSLFPEIPKQKEKEKPKPKTKNGYVSSLWSFTEGVARLPYRWYGTLPSPLVERIIRMHSSEGDRVLDPFAGSGTTLKVASQLSRISIGIDINPLACLMADARLEGLPPASNIERHINQLNNSSIKSVSKNHYPISPALSRELSKDYLAYTKKWIRPDTLNAYMHFLEKICEIENKRIQRAFFLTAAQVIRDVANVDPRCTHHLVTKKKPFIDPQSKWRDLISTVISCLSDERIKKSHAKVKQGSVLATTNKIGEFELVLAHPPYLGMIHYHLIHRLATDLFGVIQKCNQPKSLSSYDFDYAKIREADVSTDSAKTYNQFLTSFSSRMKSLVKIDGRCVLIIGDQRHKGHIRHPFSDFIVEMTKNDFLVEDLFIWELQNNAGMHILRRGNFIDHNYVIVFHKME